jgi:hypothetical protein
MTCDQSHACETPSASAGQDCGYQQSLYCHNGFKSTLYIVGLHHGATALNKGMQSSFKKKVLSPSNLPHKGKTTFALSLFGAEVTYSIMLASPSPFAGAE